MDKRSRIFIDPRIESIFVGGNLFVNVIERTIVIVSLSKAKLDSNSRTVVDGSHSTLPTPSNVILVSKGKKIIEPNIRLFQLTDAEHIFHLTACDPGNINKLEFFKHSRSFYINYHLIYKGPNKFELIDENQQKSTTELKDNEFLYHYSYSNIQKITLPHDGVEFLTITTDRDGSVTNITSSSTEVDVIVNRSSKGTIKIDDLKRQSLEISQSNGEHDGFVYFHIDQDSRQRIIIIPKQEPEENTIKHKQHDDSQSIFGHDNSFVNFFEKTKVMVFLGFPTQSEQILASRSNPGHSERQIIEPNIPLFAIAGNGKKFFLIACDPEKIGKSDFFQNTNPIYKSYHLKKKDASQNIFDLMKETESRRFQFFGRGGQSQAPSYTRVKSHTLENEEFLYHYSSESIQKIRLPRFNEGLLEITTDADGTIRDVKSHVDHLAKVFLKRSHDWGIKIQDLKSHTLEITQSNGESDGFVYFGDFPEDTKGIKIIPIQEPADARKRITMDHNRDHEILVDPNRKVNCIKQTIVIVFLGEETPGV